MASESVVRVIEHPVRDFDGWKRAFDADPAGRARLGVRRDHILRAADDPAHVAIELEFGTAAEAEALLAAMRPLWERVGGTLISNLRTRVFQVVGQVEL